MTKKMLIDAAHAEESRVVVLHGNRIEEFDFEAAAKRPLKGNIYLAKVTRVEPSLQAAFVDFGGNRHGFLAFSEIHPDYYQIPIADRQALIAQQEAAHRARPHEDDDEPAETAHASTEEPGQAFPDGDEAEGATVSGTLETSGGEGADGTSAFDLPTYGESSEHAEVTQLEADIAEASVSAPDAVEIPIEAVVRAEEDALFAVADGSNIESVAAAEPEPAKPVETRSSDDFDDAFEETRHRPVGAHGRPYKIQEVIKRRQILLVQVVKEERGTKGAALTTYLSLAGRYCVLMPNTARGGGISRKITNQADRKRLKSATQELDIPKGMGLIVRTAGANRTKAEVKRDFEYLLRVWENVRDLTLRSTAPALVYEEGSLIKRAIRDLYNKDIETILVEGEEAYKEAKGFMRTLMPSHAKVVQPYRDPVPLFQRHQVEAALDSMFSPTVNLRSGGYIVINQTEALVAIDVNSGRATRERSIEETALRTNLEAAEEAARQLRLRDLAGLIVIDFIDMEDNRNNRAVERRLKDHLKVDRARIQIGRISAFGLLEMSRQRLRSGVLEGSTIRCPHCEGVGLVRSVESAALRALRAIEDEGIKGRTAAMVIKVPSAVALYILNQKRPELTAIEARYELTCLVEADDSLPAAGLSVNRTIQRDAPPRPELREPVRFETVAEDEDEEIPVEEIEDDEERAVSADHDGDEERVAHDERDETSSEARGEARGEEGAGRRRKRRRRRGRREEGVADRPQSNGHAPEHAAELKMGTAEGEHEIATLGDDEVRGEAPSSEESAESAERRRRRRGRRGGRRNRRRDGQEERPGEESHAVEEGAGAGAEAGEEQSGEQAPSLGDLGLSGVLHPTFDGDVSTDEAARAQTEAVGPEAAPPHLLEYEPEEIAPRPAPAGRAPIAIPETPEPAPAAAPESGEPAGPAEPPRKGWWQRRFGG